MTKISNSRFVFIFLTFCVLHGQNPSQAKSEGPAGAVQPCTSATLVDAICSTSPSVVHPTQFALGYRDVAKKKAKLAKIKNDPKAIEAFLNNKIVPAIKGPGFVYYIVDGHHTARALAEESIFKLYIKVLRDDSELSTFDFLDSLKTKGQMWLYDENGVAGQDPAKIPPTILDLKDDPYRSLAEDAMAEGAFDAAPVYFQQFIWANYFRALIDRSLLRSNYRQAVDEAVAWARHPNASTLPGFKMHIDNLGTPK